MDNDDGDDRSFYVWQAAGQAEGQMKLKVVDCRSAEFVRRICHENVSVEMGRWRWEVWAAAGMCGEDRTTKKPPDLEILLWKSEMRPASQSKMTLNEHQQRLGIWFRGSRHTYAASEIRRRFTTWNCAVDAAHALSGIVLEECLQARIAEFLALPPHELADGFRVMGLSVTAETEWTGGTPHLLLSVIDNTVSARGGSSIQPPILANASSLPPSRVESSLWTADGIGRGCAIRAFSSSRLKVVFMHCMQHPSTNVVSALRFLVYFGNSW